MSNINKSLKNEKTIHGVIIKKLPIGAYLEALEAVAQLPAAIVEKLSAEVEPHAALSNFISLGNSDIFGVLCRALTVLPGELVEFFAKLVAADTEYIKNNLSPLEFAEVVTEFWKINEVENFIKQAKALVMTLR